MKRKSLVVLLGTLLVLFLTTATVLASPSAGKVDAKKTPQNPIQLTRQAGSSLTPSAHGNNQNGQSQKEKTYYYKGVITLVSTDSITVTLADLSSLVVLITPDTSIRIPTMGKTSTIANLLVDQIVYVRVTQADDLSLTAKSIMVIPGKPSTISHVGTVTDYQTGLSITIDDGTGVLFTFVVDPETKILPAEREAELAVGSVVTIISPRDVTGGPLTAKGIVVHPAGTVVTDPESTETVEPTEVVETPEP